MLSGAVIAQIISGYAVTGMGEGSVGFIMSGNVGLIMLGAVLLLVGHAFNLAIGLLGAYIHDARLQYVEFYGRFFEGEGELFAPLGSNCKYIKVVNLRRVARLPAFWAKIPKSSVKCSCSFFFPQRRVSTASSSE